MVMKMIMVIMVMKINLFVCYNSFIDLVLILFQFIILFKESVLIRELDKSLC